MSTVRSRLSGRPGATRPRPRIAAGLLLGDRRALGEWGVDEIGVAVRWTGLTLSLIALVVQRPHRVEVAGAVVLVLLALVRTVWPLRFAARGLRRTTAVVGDVVASSVVVGCTGLVTSPFLLSLGASLLLAGIAVGRGVVVLGPLAAGVATLAAFVYGGFDGVDLAGATQRVELLALICIVGASSRWLLRPRAADEADEEELERLRNLTEVNDLLLELHARAATLPGAISLRGVVASTVSRLRDLLVPELVVLLLRDPTAEEGGGSWEVAVAEGVALPTALRDDELPAVLGEASRSYGPVRRGRLGGLEGVGTGTTSGLYIPLWARESLVGLLAVERGADAPAFDEGDVAIVGDVARHAGLAIDNARWFRRLRTLGAEEERGRIARELHDRVGQSLAFVALSLDRIAGEVGAGRGGSHAADEIAGLASEVRGATAEVREKLSDLRLDVGDHGNLDAAITTLLARVEKRSRIATSFDCRGGRRLAPIVEREVWRIAQEAIVNAERHSQAARIAVRWASDASGALLEVVDDGKGTAATAPLRRDAFGILGMRERADAIGASFSLVSPPGEGTTVRLRIEAR
ncbi:MAG: GAF domain-containing sensor histidine kinase [Actinomycetota bacterium]|nr:GAF domain-containing sensor histidine kinase [Actinomycetota bacterium]